MYGRGVVFHVSYLGQNIQFFFSSDTENLYSKSYYKTLIIVDTMYHPLQKIDFINDINEDQLIKKTYFKHTYIWLENTLIKNYDWKLKRRSLLLNDRFEDDQQWWKFTQLIETVGEVIDSASFFIQFPMIQSRVWKAAMLGSVLELVVHHDLLPSFLILLFFHAAFPSQFKVIFPTVTKFMRNVLVFEICLVSE